MYRSVPYLHVYGRMFESREAVKFLATKYSFYDFIRAQSPTHTPPPHLLTPQSACNYPFLCEPPSRDQLIAQTMCKNRSRPRVELLGRRSRASPHVGVTEKIPSRKHPLVRDWNLNEKHLWKERTSLTQHCKYCRILAG